jgi:CheY-like chemotaxis protein
MPSGGTLAVRTSLEERKLLHARFPDALEDYYVCIQVTDSGMGMDAMTKSRIFEPFFTTKSKHKGTGLGLAVVHGIMKTHRGFIHVESEKGKGTTFELYFPVGRNHQLVLESPAVTESAPVSGDETILVVEDEKPLRDLLNITLEASGYRALFAMDGEEAIRVYAEHQKEIDLVLCDIGLPKIEGPVAFERFKEVNPDVRVVFVTGYLDPGTRAGLMDAGAAGIVQKPYLPLEIVRHIREAIDSRKNGHSR